MKTTSRIILGINTLLPVSVIFFIVFFSVNLMVQLENDSILGLGLYVDFLAMYLFYILINLPLVLFYIYHMRKTSFIVPSEKKVWIAGIVLFPVPVLQIYWYKFIWKK